ISKILNAFRADLSNLDDFNNYIASAATNQDAKWLFNSLIGQLAASSSARVLRLPNSPNNFTEKLFEFGVVWSPQDNFPTVLRSYCSSLLEKVASNASDLDVWGAV